MNERKRKRLYLSCYGNNSKRETENERGESRPVSAISFFWFKIKIKNYVIITSNLLDTFDCTMQTKLMLLLSSSILWITLQENFVVLCTVIAKLKMINTDVKGMLYSSSICLFNDLRTAAWTETTHLHFLWTSNFAGAVWFFLYHHVWNHGFHLL